MKNEAKIVDIVVKTMLFLGILISALSLGWLPSWSLLIGWILIIGAIRIDLYKTYAFVISSLNIKEKPREWKHRLVYTYSIKWLEFVHWREIVVKKNYPVMYKFNTLEEFGQKKREKIIQDYFDEQD